MNIHVLPRRPSFDFWNSPEFKAYIEETLMSQMLKDFILNQEYRENLSPENIEKIFYEFEIYSLKYYENLPLKLVVNMATAVFKLKEINQQNRSHLDTVYDLVNAYINTLFYENMPVDTLTRIIYESKDETRQKVDEILDWEDK